VPIIDWHFLASRGVLLFIKLNARRLCHSSLVA
jgi:hypothetical protein